jgi:hypothetical protein
LLPLGSAVLEINFSEMAIIDQRLAVRDADHRHRTPTAAIGVRIGASCAKAAKFLRHFAALFAFYRGFWKPFFLNHLQIAWVADCRGGASLGFKGAITPSGYGISTMLTQGRPAKP